MFASSARQKSLKTGSVRLPTADSVEPSRSVSSDSPCPSTAEPADRQQKSSTSTACARVETTYVADSMATDSCRYADSDTNLFDELPTRRRAGRIAKQGVSCDVASVDTKVAAKEQIGESAVECRDSESSSYLPQQEMPTLLVRKAVDETASLQVRPVDGRTTATGVSNISLYVRMYVYTLGFITLNGRYSICYRPDPI